ncbi:MAG: HesA/MoeB/ThiF family protein [bacterium]
MERYTKHINFSSIGVEGQKKLIRARVLIIGAGGLGTNFASHFARAGVGEIFVIDKDKVELGNLQRQWLYDEQDIGEYKAKAAVVRLRKINSEIKIDYSIAEFNSDNAKQLTKGFDLVIDATDNFKTRLIINDVCKNHGIPWIFTGILGAEGQTMLIVPGLTKDLRDVLNYNGEFNSGNFNELEPNIKSSVLAPSVSIMSSMAVILSFKLLLGEYEDSVNRLFVFDTWKNKLKTLNI